MKYLYYATFTLNEDNQYEVKFPDFYPMASTYGNNMPEALKSAKDSLTGNLLTMEDYDDEIPAASEPQNIDYDKTSLLIPIEADTTLAREKEKNRLIKKTVTIPSYLNEEGKAEGINFSELLTNSLKEKLEA